MIRLRRVWSDFGTDAAMLTGFGGRYERLRTAANGRRPRKCRESLPDRAGCGYGGTSTRSVKISEDERGGWSSDRPRRDGAPPRPPDVSVRCRVLSPSHEVRYSPGSLLLIVSPSLAERDRFTEGLIDNRASVCRSARSACS